MISLTERTWAEIHPQNILHNMKMIRDFVPEGTKFLGVVKANAYGHGALTVAKALEENGADYLAVACIAEAVELREAGIRMPILILGVTPQADIPLLLRYDITQTVAGSRSAAAYSAAAVAAGGRLRVHIKTDTGMSRLGFLCDEEHIPESVEAIAEVCALPGLEPEGIFMHFSVSDEHGAEPEAVTRRHFARFRAVVGALRERGITFAIRHCSATGGTLYYPEYALDMVRPGILLYGYGDPEHKLSLRPGMVLKSRVCAAKRYPAGTKISYGGTFTTQRDTRVGVLPIGYADGLHRTLSNKASFWTKDGFAPQIGRICMDMCMIDLTDLPGVGVGDEVEIFGGHVDLEDLAARAGTISYELLCAVSPRVPRVVV